MVSNVYYSIITQLALVCLTLFNEEVDLTSRAIYHKAYIVKVYTNLF